MNHDVDMSFVIPVHNEAPILEGSIREIHSRLKKLGKTFEIWVAENGSRDETFELAQELAEELAEVHTFSLGEPNYGKALREGIERARGATVHCDEIDILDIDFHKRALPMLTGEDGGFDLVVGSKVMRGSRDRRPFHRKVATRVINGMLRASLGFRGTDTHGLKAFRREQMLPIVRACVVDRDMFASEMVIRAERADMRIVEIPLNLTEKRTPSIRLHKRVPRVLGNIAKLVWVIRIQGEHD